VPDPEIRETIVTPEANEIAVQLQISDAPLPAEDAKILILLNVRLPAYETPLLVHIQREAIRQAFDALSALAQEMASEIQRDPHRDLSPKVKQRRVRSR
jgi:hypothetical protein